MIIRDARPADRAMVHRLIGQLADAPDEAEFRARFERVSADAGHRLIVAERQARSWASCMSSSGPPEKPCEAVVQALVVDGARRSSGVGEALMREAEAWAPRGSSPRQRSTPASTATGHGLLRAHRLSPEGDVASDGTSLGGGADRPRLEC